MATLPVQTDIDQTIVSTLRFLSVDMVEAAKSGHPGLPLGAAPMAYCLFSRALKCSPQDPEWFNRDRFILSAGHGSALLYSLLHVFGYDLPLEELKQFRQIGSKTPGHPEFGLTPGVEATTGPLGQGLGNAVGIALAEKWLSARYGEIIDHFTYALVSDGDLMEGTAQESASLAGHLGLGKLIALYDSNDISLDGECGLSYSEDVGKKFAALGWHYQLVEDGNNLDVIEAAISAAQEVSDKPSLIEIKTVIGYGSPLAGTSKSHGAPLGPENAAETKQQLGWESSESFYVPESVDAFRSAYLAKGKDLVASWNSKLDDFCRSNPDLGAELKQIISGELPEGWDAGLSDLTFGDSVATRDAGSSALNAIAKNVPWMIGGGADLASSTKTVIKDGGNFSKSQPDGRNIWFGVREFAMGAIVNGLAHHGLKPFGSTFLVFSDYMKGAIRLACLSRLNSLFVFSHDSVFVGEDGPTHQPIEHVETLRLIPTLKVFRPADALETVECWRLAFASDGPAVLIETRQGVPTLSQYHQVVKSGVTFGGYILRDADGKPQITLLATGSEVGLALEASQVLTSSGIANRVVSMPCREIFMAQPDDYRESILPAGSPVIAIEAGVTSGWQGLVGSGLVVGIDHFGESGPGDKVYEHVGMTVDWVVDAARRLLSGSGSQN